MCWGEVKHVLGGGEKHVGREVGEEYRGVGGGVENARRGVGNCVGVWGRRKEMWEV